MIKMAKLFLHIGNRAISFLRVGNITQRLSNRALSTSGCLRQDKKFNEPTHGDDMARAGGIASMMRLPIAETAEGLDACFVGVPIDHGTSNRSGTRLGPRQIRTESVLLRKYNIQTGADPFSSIQVADVGDVKINPYNLVKSCDAIREHLNKIVDAGCRPLTLGGDHTITYPILQAVGRKHGPVALVHVDAHSDTADTIFGEKISHASPFRRAVEENLLDTSKVFQIGIRGPVGGGMDEFDWALDKGFRIIPAHECWHKSLSPLMEEIRGIIGNDTPTYISFDIDGLDPSVAPGTGTPEIGGLTSIQGLEIIRGCRGLNVVGGDLVEVSPPYDTTGTTALIGANYLFEMLCVLPGVKYHK